MIDKKKSQYTQSKQIMEDDPSTGQESTKTSAEAAFAAWALQNGFGRAAAATTLFPDVSPDQPNCDEVNSQIANCCLQIEVLTRVGVNTAPMGPLIHALLIKWVSSFAPFEHALLSRTSEKHLEEDVEMFTALKTAAEARLSVLKAEKNMK